MSALIVPLTDEERGIIANELDKLYAFQGRPLPKESKAFLVQEISVQGLPYKAIVEGIRSLFVEDLKSVKLAFILKAAREHIQIAEAEAERGYCKHCSGVGSVTLCDDQKISYALACICAASEKMKGSVRWNGQWVQIINGRTLEVPERFRN